MTDTRRHYESKGQGHVFAFADSLGESERAELERRAADIDLDEVAELTDRLVRGSGDGRSDESDSLEPAEFVARPDREGGDRALWEKARETGEVALRGGRVAAFTVAGGQGTRLGYDGPKGTYGVTPVLGNSLFQVFAEKILASSRLYGQSIPWFIMTSGINHDETVAFFEENEHFGLPPDTVHFFTQGLMPAVDAEGKILLADEGTIALSPDGHGGALRALVRSGSIRRMEAEGIDIISYFQVDNPLVRCIDPAFIGFHLLRDSELSSKMVPKAYPEEKVGVFCRRDGRTEVVEYSDLPDEFARATDENGDLRFRSGSIAIHLFDRDFVQRLGGGAEDTESLPFHLAHKKVSYLDGEGRTHSPEEPNAYKFELFVFDALPFARNPVIVETAREDDFSPVKNAEGVDSPQTARDDQLRQFARWARAAGVEIETDDTGLPPFSFEVSPLFADDTERFRAAWEGMTHRPHLGDGLVLV